MEFFKLSSLKFYIACLSVLFMSGCTLFQPFVDRKRNPGTSDISKLYSGSSKPNAPVICYNPLFTDDNELQQMADDVCKTEETGDRAELQGKNYIDGKLLLPAKARYLCVKTSMENSEEQKNESDTGK